MSLVSINPYSNKIIKKYKLDSAKLVSKKLELASIAQLEWKEVKLKKRIALLNIVKRNLQKNKTKFAELITDEMGKPIVQSYHELEKTIGLFDYYAKNVEQILKEKITTRENNQKSIITYQPLGAILGIMPWNFPIWQVFRNLIPILLSGNVYVLKHASNVYGCANAILNLFKEAGFEDGVVTLLQIGSDAVKKIIENDKIAAVTITGSVGAGKSVASLAGANLKKCVLELGGNDAYIVLDDADINLAVDVLLQSRMLNSGQSCVCAKRFIVTRKNKKVFEDLLLQKIALLNLGDPMQKETNIGPLAKPEINDELDKYINNSIKKGAVCIYTSAVPTQGNFYPVTILTNVTENMPAFMEELFGPVCVIVEAKNNEDALRLANNSKFGLGGGIISKNISKAKQIAINDFESGMVAVNNFVRSTYDMPFGGIKQSGYGRELAEWGLLEFCNVKYITVK